MQIRCGHVDCVSGRLHKPFTSCNPSPHTRVRQAATASSQQQRPVEIMTRRVVLSGLAAFFALPVQQATAGFGWDGSSAAQGSCALGDDGAECRRQQLLKDRVGTSAYPSAKQEGRPQATTAGIPVAEMTDAYTKETFTLGNTVEKYFGLEPFDPERTKVVKAIKTDGAAWASKYARGGSARKLSARKFYIVVDALQGFITSNGFAPFPNAKAQALQKNIAETRELLAKGS